MTTHLHPVPQARATDLKSCVVVLRVFRDMCNTLPQWQPLNGWVRSQLEVPEAHSLPAAIALVSSVSSLCCRLQPLELICEKAIATCNRPLGPGEALRRVMECIASGILLPGSASSSLFLPKCFLSFLSLKTFKPFHRNERPSFDAFKCFRVILLKK